MFSCMMKMEQINYWRYGGAFICVQKGRTSISRIPQCSHASHIVHTKQVVLLAQGSAHGRISR